jgi:hypothetical protein
MKTSTPSVLRLSRALGSGIILLASTLASNAAFPTGNLIVNGSGQSETNVGWTILASVGNGWARSSTGGADSTPGFFLTSYSAPSRRSQTIDLLALGATEAEMDTSPPIRFSEFISMWGTNSGTVDKFYIRVELRGATNNVIASWNVGTNTAPVNTPSTWTKYEHTFTGYPAGVRYIYVEDGGYDTGFWAGHYGSYHDAATVEIIPDSDLDGLPNPWEEANGTDPFENGTLGESSPGAKDGPNGSAGDLDQDGLTNLQEYGLLTRADLKDTDGDGLWDSWEDKIGSWLSSTATGTDPLKPDTDRDGLLDGEENLDIGETDPNLADTDFDGYLDGVEVIQGSDPLTSGEIPTTPIYQVVMRENFDGDSVNSTYAFTTTSGSHIAAVTNSGVPTNANAAQLTASGIGSSNTSIAWNSVPANADSIQLSFDFSLTAGADGLGIGLFKTGTYGATGAANPGAATNWEDPKVGGVMQNAVVLGFRIYNANVFHFVSPEDPKVDRVAVSPPFSLSSGVFHRAVVTAYRAGPGTTVFDVDLIQDINGAATTSRVATNVVAKNFDIGTDAWRLIAGGRTGGVTTTTRLDNIVVSTSGGSAPTELKILTSVFNKDTNPPVLSISWTSAPGSQYTIEESTTLATDSWTTVQSDINSGGTVTTYDIPVPNGSPDKKFFRVKEE